MAVWVQNPQWLAGKLHQPLGSLEIQSCFIVFGLKGKNCGMEWDGMARDGMAAAILSQKRKELSYCTIQGDSGGLQAALSPGHPLALGTTLPRNHNFIATFCNTVMNAK